YPLAPPSLWHRQQRVLADSRQKTFNFTRLERHAGRHLPTPEPTTLHTRHRTTCSAGCVCVGNIAPWRTVVVTRGRRWANVFRNAVSRHDIELVRPSVSHQVDCRVLFCSKCGRGVARTRHRTG